MKDKPIIQTEDLCYGYTPETLALSHISVSFYKGEKVAILGANGAGKSTFFLALNGVLPPDSGAIILNGAMITKAKKDRILLHREVGIVFQDADNQMIASTVQQEVSFGPMNLKLSIDEVRQRVKQAISYMNLEGYEERPPHSLSGGEKKRVSIADIIAMQGSVIAFDEPTASLDPVNAQMLETVLEALTKEEKTLLVSTHDVDFAYRWADRILILHQGELLADGGPPEIFRDDALLARTNLRKPTILAIYDMMLQKEIIKETWKENCKIPKTVQDLDILLR